MTDARTRDDLESASLRAPRILALAVAALVLLFGSIGGLALYYRAEVPSRPTPAPRIFPEPRLRVDEATQLHDLQARQRDNLNNYRWIDRQNGIIGIPIARAMQLIAKRGADAYKPVPGAPAQPKAGP